MRIGQNIKKIRAVKGWSQTRFAEEFGLTRGAVGAYEEGRADPKLETLISIAKKISVSVDEFIHRELTVNQVHGFGLVDELIQQKQKTHLVPLIKPNELISLLKNEESEVLQKVEQVWVPNTWSKVEFVLKFYGRLEATAPAENHWLFIQTLKEPEIQSKAPLLSILIEDEIHVGSWNINEEHGFVSSEGIVFPRNESQFCYRVMGVMKGTENFYFQ